MTHAAAPGGLTYRSDIDGLRGISVLLVMAFHFNLAPISGGYIGVDIFFVISGFLITSLLSLESTFFPALNHFYRRRIKRLLPMFIVFSAVSTAGAAVVLLPEDFLKYLRSLYFSLIFQANTFFDLQTRGYFAPNARELPLLHIWSLAIEWQFYFIFPAVFLLARRWLPSRALILGTAMLTAILALTSWHQTGNSQQAYFHTSARFFELLVGCFAALVTIPAPSAFQRNLAGCAVALLFSAAILFDGKTPFPGIPALQVCLLTAIVLSLGAGNRLLEFPALVHAGRISYSAYLWHWPVVSYFGYLQIPIPPGVGIALMIIVLGLAHLSYSFVEKPGRKIQLPLWKLVLYFIALPAIVASATHKIARNHDGWFERLGDESMYIYGKIQPFLDNAKLDCRRFKAEGRHECSLGDVASASTIYLIGDSHAGHYQWFVDVMAKDARLHVLSSVQGQCLMLPGAAHALGSEHAAQCERAVIKDFARINTDLPKYVLIGQRWIGYSYDEVKKLDGTVGALLARGITPVILGPVAETGDDLKSCFYQHIKLRRPYRGECSFKQDNDFQSGSKKRISVLFADIRKKYPQAILINVQDVQCAHGVCTAEIAGVPIYDDTHHINGYGASTLARHYIERFGNPLRTATNPRKTSSTPRS